MNSKELITTIGKITGKSLRTISKEVGVGSQLLGQKVNSGRLRFKDACQICDAVGLRIELFDVDRHVRIEFDVDRYLLSDNDVRFDDAIELFEYIGVEVAIASAASGTVITAGRSGYGRRIRAWVEGVAYDTMRCNALSSGLKKGVYKYGGTGKYETDDPRELYRDTQGRFFFAVYGENRTKDSIVPCTPEEAQAFIDKYGDID